MRIDPKRFGSIKAVAKAIGRSEGALRGLIEAYELTFKPREKGLQVKAARAPPEEARWKGEAIPLKHTELVAQALKSETVKRLPAEVVERKVPEIVKAIAPLPEEAARKEEALVRETGVSIRIYFPPGVAQGPEHGRGG